MQNLTRIARGLLMLAAATLAAPLAAQVRPAPAQHTILISIDGFRPDVYLDPARTGVKLPNLAALVASGVSAERMIGVFPSVTYPSHTTMVTGVNPARHGIANNFKPGTRDWYLEAAAIKTEPLWRAFRKAGKTAAIVTWPASYGADVDWLIPENLSFGIADVPGAIARGATPGLIDELAATAGRFDIPTFEAIDGGEKLDRMTEAYAAALLKRHKPDLLLLHFLDTDHQEHRFGPYSPEAGQAFETIDARLGRLLAALDAAGLRETTNIVIVGDHGFARVHSQVNVDVLLRSMARELGWPEAPAQWPVEAHIDGGGLGFFLKPGAAYGDRGAIVTALRRQVETRLAHLARLISAEDLVTMGSYPGAIAGLSIIAEGYTLSDQPGAELITPTENLLGMHGYLPDMPQMATGFIASGPAFKRGYRMPVMRTVDLAPTIAAASGIVLRQTDGNAVAGILARSDSGSR